MGTKNDPGAYDCYAAAKPDEPMFVLLARDPLAPILVDLWADLRKNLMCDPKKAKEACKVAQAMREYYDNQNPQPHPLPPV